MESVYAIQTDPVTTKEAEKVFSEYGLSVAEAINLFFIKAVKDNCIPFDVESPRYNEVTMAAIKEVEEMDRNPHLFKSFKTVEDLFEDLESDDDV